MKKNVIEVIESPIKIMGLQKFAKEIGKTENWVKERCNDGSIPTIENEAPNQEFVIDLDELNRRIRAKLFVITSPRSTKKDGMKKPKETKVI